MGVSPELEARVVELEAQVQRLTHLLEQATRASKRQAVPFSKGEPKRDPKPPGRRPGPDYGTPAFRAPPPAPPSAVQRARRPLL
jgi:transposase